MTRNPAGKGGAMTIASIPGEPKKSYILRARRMAERLGLPAHAEAWDQMFPARAKTPEDQEHVKDSGGQEGSCLPPQMT